MVDERSLAVLEARNISKAFGGAAVLRDVSFKVSAGDFVVMRGPNGAGKTTLLNIISGLLAPDSGAITLKRGDGSLRFRFGAGERSNAVFSLATVARGGVLRSWQDVRLFSSLSLVDNLNVARSPQRGERPGVVLCNSASVRAEESRVNQDSLRLLESFGLAVDGSDGSLDRAATGSTISLGQAKRVAIARACRAGATLLLLDEPLSGLDRAGIASVKNLLERLNREQGVAIILIEHESSVAHVADLAKVVWKLEGGSLATEGSLQTDLGRERFVRNWVQSITRHGEHRVTQTLPHGARLTTIQGKRSVPEPPPALSLEALRVLRGGRPVLPPISFALPRGSVALIEAPNGWGKTSLAEAISGLLPVSSGAIALNGKAIQQEPPWERRRKGLSLFQSRSVSFPKLRVDEALRVSNARVPDNLNALLNRTIASLSGGERQRVLLACAQARDDACLFLWDEPFLSLDEAGLRALTQAVRDRKPQQTFLILLPAITVE